MFSLYIYIIQCISPGGYRDVRLGRNGANEVKKHAWFKNVPWTWENIHQKKSYFEPNLRRDDDTQYYNMNMSNN